ncbi:MAG: hypothetical protein EXS13_03250 [Planctomycetes bacterium]|nr:hypothetical protein [Planctomycetota bacterium]
MIGGPVDSSGRPGRSHFGAARRRLPRRNVRRLAPLPICVGGTFAMPFCSLLVSTLLLAPSRTDADGGPFECPALARPIVVDGDVSEWQLSEGDWRPLAAPNPPAQKDVSASAVVRFDRDALYIAFQLQDEQRVADTPNFWDADGIEVSLEPLPAAGVAPARTRLVLLPFNVGRRFGVVRWQGKPLLGAGGIAGIELATREVAEGSGSFMIEARLPLRPLAIDPQSMPSIGFELAVRDKDGGERAEGEQISDRVDLSWSGVVERPTAGSTLPQLRFEGDPAEPRGRALERPTGVGIAAAFAVLLLMWVVGKTAKRAGRAAQRRSARWHLVALVGFGAIACLLLFGVDVIERIATWRVESALRSRGDALHRALRDLDRPEVAARLRGADDVLLRELLEGRELPIAESNRFAAVPVLADDEKGPGDYRSLDPIAGIPFSEYGVRIGGPRGVPDSIDVLDFTLEEPQRVRRVHLAVAALLPAAALAETGQIVDAIEVQLRFANRPADVVQIRRFTIDDARSDPIGHQSRTWGRARLRAGPRDEPWLAGEVAGQELRHVDHFVVELDAATGGADGEAALARLTLSPTRAAAGATIWVSGITLELAGAPSRFVPLALGGSDRNGYPMPMRSGRPAPRELRASPKGGGEATRSLLYGRPGQGLLELQRLRLYYRAEGPVLRALADTATLRVRAWVLVTLDGDAEPLRFPLRAGLEIDDAQLYEPQHPASMTSFLASTFETRQGLLHYDGYELPLPAPAGGAPLRVAKVEIEQPSASRGALVIAGMSALVLDQPPPPPRLDALVLEQGKLALVASLRAELVKGDPPLGFAVARGGVIRQVGGELGGELARLLGTGLAREAQGVARGEVRRERRLGHELLTCTLQSSLGGAGCDVLLFCERPQLLALRAGRTLVAWGAGLLALPFLLLLLVDALSRVARVRTRLSFLFLLTSLAPLVVLFVVLANLLAGEQRSAEERRSGELLAQVRERVDRLCGLATDHAQRVLRELEASEVLTASVSDDEVRRRLQQMAPAFPDPDATVAIVVEAPSEEGAARRIHSDALVASDPRFDAPNEGLALSWGEVVFSGSAENRRRGFKVRVAGRVDRAVLAALRLEPGDSEATALIAPRQERAGGDVDGGEPLATRGALRIDGSIARAAARELDAGRGSYFEPLAGGGTCGFDLLRGSAGDAVAVVAASIGARPLRVRIGPLDVDLTWFVLVLGAVILAASNFLGAVVTDGITRPIARMLRGAMQRIEGARLAPRLVAGRDDGEDEVASLETSVERLWDELAQSGRQQALLIELIGAMSQPADLPERARRALGFVRELVGGRASCCYLVDPVDESLANIVETRDPAAAPFPARLELKEARDWLRERRPRSVDLSEIAGGAPDWAAEGRRLLVLPLELGVQAIGLIVVVDDAPIDPLAQRDPALVAGVVGQAAAGIERARLATRTIEDPETGLAAHGYFAARVNEELDRAAHGRRPIVVLQARLELPNAADPERREEVRRIAGVLAREMRRICRDREIVGRAGPLELEALLPYGGRPRAEEIVTQWRERLSDPQAIGPDLVMRLRAAFVVFPEEARSADFLFGLLRRRLDASIVAEASPKAEETLERFRQRFPEYGFGSARMQPVLRQLEKVAASDASVLLVGETGTGKEVAAQLLHRLSPRAGAAFVVLNCAALPEALLEAELFGHEKGAFTGAEQRRIGRFEQAHGGTLFLDEVAEIPLTVQVKLLRVLQERKIHRLGGREEIAVDVRLVAATHRVLEREVLAGTFREDLLYRLKVVTLELPPLRERLDEIPHLVDRFLAARRAIDPNCRVRGIEPAALDSLARHAWPGNVRELRNVIERAIVLGEGEWIRRDDLDLGTAAVVERAGASRDGRSSAQVAAVVDNLAPPAPTAPRDPLPGGETTGALPPVAASGTVARDPQAPPTRPPFTERQTRLLALVRADGGAITSKRYCEHAVISQRTALRELAELVEGGFLIRDGSRRGAVYRLVSADGG